MSLVQGVDGDKNLIPLLVDATGKVLVSAVVTSLPTLPAGDNNIGNVDVVTLPALPVGTNEIGMIQARAYGRIGGAWQKQPLLIGYSDVVRRQFSNTNLGAGANNVDDSVVPAGEVWVITNFNIRYVGTSPTWIEARILSGGTSYALFRQLAPTTAQTYDRPGWWPIKPGENLRASVLGATAGDDLYAEAVGFSFDIDL